MKRNYSVSKDNDNEKVELEKITIKTPKINVQIQFSTQFGTSHFKGHLNAIICFTDGTIDEQMILGGIPRLVKTCTSYIESYGLRMTGIYRVSGAAQRIKTLEDKFNLDPLHFDIDSTVYKVHDVAVLLKVRLWHSTCFIYWVSSVSSVNSKCPWFDQMTDGSKCIDS